MADLARFREAVIAARRSAGYTQQQLARAIGMHPHVLSHKVNGHSGSILSTRDVIAVVATLTSWGAVGTRADADDLLTLMAVPHELVAEQSWYARLAVGDERLVPDRLRPVPLPEPVTPLVGRRSVLDAVRRTVLDGRLVTLTGSGGTGKTRVALAAARELAPMFRDGVAFADVASVSDPAALDVALSRAVGVPLSAGVEQERMLAEALRPAQLLLVVDNMEHLLAGAVIFGRLLRAAPELRILVTSRAVLRLYGEQQFPVPPLGLPADSADTPEGIRRSEAVQLFLQRAAAVRPGFDAQGDALTAVAEICTALEGLPLAVELAAARARGYSPRGIAAQLRNRLSLLAGGPRDQPARQRSLLATLAWSDDLLEPDERRLFHHVGAFVGSFGPAAAAAVVGTIHEPVLDGLEKLCDQSLLERFIGGLGGEPRFRMLETVRFYALAQLEVGGELEAARAAHLRHFADWAAAMTFGDAGSSRDALLDQLQQEVSNLRAALDHACAGAARDPVVLTDGLRLATAVSRMWNRRASATVGRLYLEQLLTVADGVPDVPAEVVAVAKIRGAILANSNGDLERSSVLAAESVELCEELGDLPNMSFAISQLGAVALARDDLDLARDRFTRQLALARRAGDRAGTADAYNMLGQTSARAGRLVEAERELRLSVRAYAALGDADGEGNVWDSLAELAIRRSDIAAASEHLTRAFELHTPTGNRRALAYHFEGCAKLAAMCDRAAAAQRNLAASALLRRQGAWVLPGPEQQALDLVVAGAVASLSVTDRAAITVRVQERALGDLVADAVRDLAELRALSIST